MVWYVNRKTDQCTRVESPEKKNPKCIWEFMLKAAPKNSGVTKNILVSIVGLTG